VHARSQISKSRRAERFHGFCGAVVVRLPLGLSSVVPPTFLGFCLINGLTFGIDLLILSGLHSALRLPVPISVTAAYVCAFALSYVLNRALNFRSHAPVGPQVVVYVVVVVVNYLAFIVGVTTVLVTAGVQLQLSRIVAGMCEAVYMYSAMRWLVFRR
jgi:putative flippase GtrA